MISLKKNTCRVLIVAMMALSFQTARAGMIGTEQAAAVGGAATQRSLVMSVLDRAETAAQLQAQGIDPAMARERVASMTDQEVLKLAGDMHTAPAGGLDAGGWLAVVVVAGLIWYFAFRR
ncbi:PA2779 family protein [Caenimonas terrae]|uniref:PA2779 family protein n=1 Tax=Caenimonas terrae TaxID=696074 RepID=A0ABW0NE20_9BURK